MNLSDLTGLLFAIVGRHPEAEGFDVAVSTRTPGIPTNVTPSIKSIYVGGEWQRNRVLLVPETDLVVMRAELKDPIREVAARRLKELRAAYAGCGQNYDLPKCREPAWIDGFVEGVELR
jgi:hypothetical protein